MRHGRVPKLTIMGMRVSALVDLYRWRLSNRKAQELLAGTGIAIGVALFFGVLVANMSLVSSTSQLLHAVTGSARLQLAARSPEGFEQGIAKRVAGLPGVKIAAPLLRENAMIVGPHGREAIQLVGVTAKQVALGGTATRNLGAGALVMAGEVGLPAGVAASIGASTGNPVTLLADGAATSVQVRAILGTQIVGPIANSPIVVALLSQAQQIAGKPDRVTQVLVEPRAGAQQLVERELRTVAAGRLNVEPASEEVNVLRATARPTSQSTNLFAAISAIVGFLLALNAMLLTVPERRRFVAELRQQGFEPGQVLLVLISQAVMLGLAASLVGVVLGDVLSRSLFHEVPAYITLAFPIGTRPVIPPTTVALAIACGVVATLIASLVPVLDLRRGRPADAVLHEAGEAGQGIGRRSILISGLTGLLLVLAVTVLVVLSPSLSVAGGVVLALAAFCLVVPVFMLAIRSMKPISERLRGSMLALAVVELDATATRSVALAGVAALAVYGTITIEGARHDLITGLDSALVQYLNTADIWVTTNNNFLTIDSFRERGAGAAIARSHDVASVRVYQGSLLDVGTRRLWIRARPTGDNQELQASQLLHGGLAQATRLIRGGGWAAVSNGFAAERHLRVGSAFTLPTPSGRAQLHVAAITTNVGWPPGAITLADADYQRYWQSRDPTALEVNLKPGVSPQAGRAAVQRALGYRRGLVVETLGEREALYEESARQGIKSLSQIATLLLIATSVAIAAALSAAIWQRRTRLASLKSHGFDSSQLWRSLLLESAIVMSIGCLDGAIFGIYGHALASRWLQLSVGFPAPFSLGIGVVFLTLASIVAVALLVIALPGLGAARVLPRASFQESL
jgi:putative ABC transport system permease protein